MAGDPDLDRLLPEDSDVDLRIPAQRAELPAHRWSVLGSVAAGGALGALARYALATVVPARPAGFPWATFLVNASGCLLIGVLMVLVTAVFTGVPLMRPFLGVGVLGGYTTFSTYIVDIRRLLDEQAVATALAYTFGTLAVALLCTYAGIVVTERLVAARFKRLKRLERLKRLNPLERLERVAR